MWYSYDAQWLNSSKELREASKVDNLVWGFTVPVKFDKKFVCFYLKDLKWLQHKDGLNLDRMLYVAASHNETLKGKKTILLDSKRKFNKKIEVE